jgi:hypothetical protein
VRKEKTLGLIGFEKLTAKKIKSVASALMPANLKKYHNLAFRPFINELFSKKGLKAHIFLYQSTPI